MVINSGKEFNVLAAVALYDGIIQNENPDTFRSGKLGKGGNHSGSQKK